MLRARTLLYHTSAEHPLTTKHAQPAPHRPPCLWKHEPGPQPLQNRNPWTTTHPMVTPPHPHGVGSAPAPAAPAGDRRPRNRSTSSTSSAPTPIPSLSRQTATRRSRIRASRTCRRQRRQPRAARTQYAAFCARTPSSSPECPGLGAVPPHRYGRRLPFGIAPLLATQKAS